MFITDNIEIYNEECEKILTKKIENKEYVDLILTDPPYGCNATQKGDYCDSEDFIKGKIPIWVDLFYKILKDNSYCYIFVPSLYIENWIVEVKKHFKFLNILAVENMKVGRQYKDRFRNNCQLVLVLSKGKPKGFNNIDWILTSDAWYNDKRNINPKRYTSTYPSYIPNTIKATVESSFKLDGIKHNDEKNSIFLEKLIEISTKENEIVCDPFFGSGSCIKASYKTNRKFLGCEINEKYFKLGKSRIMVKK